MEKPPPPPTSGSPRPSVAGPSTTYVQADAAAFREVVQRLTGPIDGGGAPPQRPATALRLPSPTKSRVAGVKRPPLGLQERRRQGPPRQALVVIPRPAAGLQPFYDQVAAPARSPLVSPSASMAGLCLGDSGEPASAGGALVWEEDEEEEEKAIREKRFYLHPSPRSGEKKTVEPALLPLFPTTPTTTSSAERP